MSYDDLGSVKDPLEAVRSLFFDMEKMRGDLAACRSEVSSLNRNNSKLNTDNRKLRKEVVNLKGEIKRLNGEIKRLNDENAGLRQRLGDEPPPVEKDSTNSSVPPTQQSISNRVTFKSRSLREPSGKRTGGQPGHKGHWIAKSPSPDAVVEHKASVCPHCGGGIDASVEHKCVKSVQVIDIAGVLEAPVVTEHRKYAAVCPHCGNPACGDLPTKECKSVKYGPKLQTLAVYLSVVHSLPYARICEIVRDVFCVEHFSEGTLKNILKRNKDKAMPIYRGILSHIEKEAAAGMDETGVYINKELCWFWCLQCPKYCFVFPDKSRGIEALERHGIIKHLTGLTLYTDRHGTYFKLDVKDHQVCLAHLLRNLQYLNDIDAKQTWAKRVQGLLREAIHTSKGAPTGDELRKRFDKRMAELLEEDLSNCKKDFQIMQNGLINCQDYIFTFLNDSNVPPDNNSSERTIRVLKVKGKVSGGFRTGDGAEEFACFHSIAETAKRNDIAKFKALYRLIAEMAPGEDFIEKLISTKD